MDQELSRCKQAVSACLDTVLDEFGSNSVADGMRYATQGGKRLRAYLVMESAALHGIADATSVWAAASIEAMHAYSLVHDDLPAMDDDDLRRGQPTVHRKWDEATAILVGDALQTLSFDLLTRPEFDVSDQARIALLRSLAQASGVQGMVLGQAQDIAAETAERPLTLTEITALQRNKTGALIEWSAQAGAVMAGRDTTHLGNFARALGLAFQIQDDILDVEGDVSKIGKAVGKDADAGKATFVSLLGLAGAKSRAASLVEEAKDALEPYGETAGPLRDLAAFVISRDT
ncbi:farnesyl diphosphate synthase [Celeribacter arenosi]|uniref:Polyprenyl synthetase family protein n=1 Tax=Celeribacter arenosi TaxID=792649 RepID=A0ABP7JX88_9RHOB